MFERFTERARQVVVLAQEEARILKHDYIGTEHILLGLLREGEGVAAQVLESLGITVDRVRAQVVRIVGSGEDVTSGQIPFTPRAKKVLELSMREALLLGHDHIGTEHVLLGLARENEGLAARILLDFDADVGEVRDAVMRVLSAPGYRATAAAARSPRARVPMLEEIGLSDAVLDGATPVLQILIGEIERRSDRTSDAGDLLVLLASVPDGLAAGALAGFGADAGTLAEAAEKLRSEGVTSALLPPKEGTSEADRVREELEAALARAEELRKRESELLEEAVAEIEMRHEQFLDEVRTRLRLSEDRDA